MSQYQLTNLRGKHYATGSKADCIEAALRSFRITGKPFLLKIIERKGVTYVTARGSLGIFVLSAI